MSFLEWFVEHESAMVQGKTTKEVCEMLKKRTQIKKCSYTDLLRAKGEHHHVGLAMFFVSHAWGGKFIELVAAVKKVVVKKGLSFQATYLWIDIFVVNQHLEISDFKYWTSNFEGSLVQIGHAIIVLSPWRKPMWVERAWCLFEYLTICHCRIEHDFSFPMEDEVDFIKCLEGGGGILEAVAAINMENAVAYNKRDEEGIKEFVKE